MRKAPIPHDENERLKTLVDYQVLDTLEEQHLDEITQTAALLCDCKIALISLVDKNRQWFKSKHGLNIAETTRDISYCSHAILNDDLFIVEDAKNDLRFCDNPLFLNGPQVRFYAGAPLVSPNGHRIGTLCVIDSESKVLNEIQKSILKLLSQQIITFLELKKKTKEMNEFVEKSQKTFSNMLEGVVVQDHSGKIVEFNQQALEILGLTADQLLGRDSMDPEWKALKFDGTPFPGEEHPAMVALKTGKVVHNIIMGVEAPQKGLKWININSSPYSTSAGTHAVTTFQDMTELMLKNSELKNANAYLDLTLESTGLGIWDWDLIDNKLTFDKRWAQMAGLTQEELSHDLSDWESRVHPDDLKKCYNDMNNYMEGRTSSYENIHRMRHAKGHWVYILAKGKFSLWNEEGKPTRFTGTNQDITELENTKLKLSLFYQNSPFGFSFCDLKGNLIDANKRYEQITGYSLSELQKLTYWDITPKEYEDQELKQLESLELIGKYGPYRKEYLHKNGHRIPVELNGFIIEDFDGKKGIWSIIEDISIELEREKELEQARNKKLDEFNEIVSSTPSCLKIISHEGSLIDVNPQGLSMLEAQDFQSVQNACIYDVISPDFRSKYIEFNQKICAGGKGHLIYEVTGLKGTKRWMESYAAPYKLASGEVGNISITNDITDKINAQKEYELQKSLAQHQAKLASIGELAAGVGHEINNPLTIVKGHLINMEKMLCHDEVETEKMQLYINKINLATDRIAKIVQGLRNFSRQDSKETETFSPLGVILESLDMINEIYIQEGISLKKTLDIPSILNITGHRGVFQQILMNLLSNAKDATVNKSDRKIEINASSDEGNFKLEIKDNGHGIPESLRRKIFEPFFTTKEINKGTGIGLALVNKYVSEMDGSINLVSEENQGTTFTIKIPAILQQHMDTSQSRQEQNEDDELFNINAILAEDEDDIRDLLIELLESLGLKITPAENGQKALELYTADPEKYDLIISDMLMPKMGGDMLFESIHSDQDLPKPKFILMTGGMISDLEKKDKGLFKLLDGYIYKPFEEEKILEVLRHCFKN